MADNELFGNSEQLDCSDCVNHGGDWDCDHVHCCKGTDTISRRATLKAMDTWDKFGCDPDGKLVRYDDDSHYVPYVHYDDMVHAIKALPSAQKKGHWIDEGTNYSCSECHRGCWVNSNYCPWCGADMRGERDG